MILEKLENNNFENRHFFTTGIFFGRRFKLLYFLVYDRRDKFFVEQVNDFFSRKIIFPKIQTGGSDIKIKLTKSQISKIEKIYAKDFKLIQK